MGTLLGMVSRERVRPVGWQMLRKDSGIVAGKVADGRQHAEVVSQTGTDGRKPGDLRRSATETECGCRPWMLLR